MACLFCCCGVQKLKKLIDEKYRINLVLDNLPVTAQDLLDEVRRRPGGGGGKAKPAFGGAAFV